ncbi:hypothetical protein BDEG_20957 [Batrachochytrium dendrobatidis JEL423]|uniref:Kinesin-like protein n=1 Tax=Batrachochytrium dendrobatidis (strain JEL423) TaxID=403673 RepID=A0A177WB55_BATDL|nr:hypothetical protein BDEG_20957 [Batrachochytrium dendrobatidis JEL423]
MLSGGARRIPREPAAGNALSASTLTTSPAVTPLGKQAVKVVIRVRPSLAHEHNSEACITTTTNDIYITNPRNTTEQLQYTFDKVFGESDSQESVFVQVEPVILSVFSGINTTIFAYGQTGSGKTHTINGSLKAQGIIPRTISYLLNHIKENALETSISVSYLEIYNERIFDLLATGDTKSLQNLDLRENAKGNIIVSGHSSTLIRSVDDFEKLHQTALKNRSTAATNLNELSSRSHFIMQISINTTLENGKTLMSKLHIIDLAGSEDNKRTGNVGARMVESGAINKSLFVLGQVVEGMYCCIRSIYSRLQSIHHPLLISTALNKGQQRVPYRDSKITRLLQDSLGGSAIGLMIACCASGQEHYWDTYNTLNFASKSSFIKNTVVRHEIAAKPVIPQIQQSIFSGSSSASSGILTSNRKQELLEWKLRTKTTPQQSTDIQKSRQPRHSNASTVSDASDVSQFQNVQLDELVQQKVEAQVNAHLATLRAELLDRTNIAQPFQSSLCTTLHNDLVMEAEKAVSQGWLVDAIVAFKRALVLESPNSVEYESTLARIAKIEQLQRQEEQHRISNMTNTVSEHQEAKTIHSIEQVKQDTEKVMLRIINSGSLKDIMKLKQVGKKRAEAIMNARDTYGDFMSIKDLSRAGMSETLISTVFQSNLQL